MDRARSRSYSLLIIVLLVSALGFTLLMNLSYRAEGQHFVSLAQSFLHGRLDLPDVPPGTNDYADHDGKVYWPLGPLPAILLMPAVAVFGSSVSIGYLALIFIGILLWAVFRLSRRIGFTKEDSMWLVFAYAFASPFLSVIWIPQSWQVAHVIANALIFMALLELFGRKRWWLIGTLLGGVLASRPPAVLEILFFAAVLVWEHRTHIASAAKKVPEIGIPIVLTLFGLFAYNNARFGSILEFGYGIANFSGDLALMRSYGLLSLAHVPGNLYYMLFAAPLPVTRGVSALLQPPYLTGSMWGIGLVFSAPYLISLIWKRYYDRINAFLLMTVVITAVPIILFFSVGPFQIGSRFALDFFPLLFFFFMRTIWHVDQKIETSFKVLFVLAFLLGLHVYLGGLLS